MNKINFRFLNYKTYNSFKTALDDNRILDDSIVFIQDKKCIWARGKEYICDGPYTTDTDDNGTVTLRKGNGDMIFKISQKDGKISITDSAGNVNSATYATKKYIDDSIRTKQDKLQAGNGIIIEGTKISSTLNTDIYEFITELGDASKRNPNKIYILETVVDGQTSYKQYKVKDGQWILLGDVSPTVNLDGYLKTADANSSFQPKGSYVTEEELATYALSDTVSEIANSLQDYAQVEYVSNKLLTYKDYLDNNFVRKEWVYNPKQDDLGTNDGTGGGSGSGYSSVVIAVDYELNSLSSNPVENRVVTLALSTKATKQQLADYATLAQLNTKADKQSLVNYVTTEALSDSLAGKQDYLTAGKGIKIANNTISADLEIDTSVYMMVDELPVTSINENKIYLLKEQIASAQWSFGGEFPITFDEATSNRFKYTQYKWDSNNNEWVKIGDTSPTIDLSKYISRSDALETFAPKNNYATASQLSTALNNLEYVYQPRGNYIVPDDLSTLATTRQLEVQAANTAQTYVPNAKVYTEDAGIPGSTNPGWDSSNVGIISRGVANTVFLTKGQYDALVRNGLVKENVYYFTYEGDDDDIEIDNWAFGGTFPIILM